MEKTSFIVKNLIENGSIITELYYSIEDLFGDIKTEKTERLERYKTIKFYWNPLFYFIETQNDEMFNLCINLIKEDRMYFAFSNGPYGESSLHVAAYVGNIYYLKQLVPLFLEIYSIDIPDNHGKTPFQYAKENGQIEACNFLYESGASYKKFDDESVKITRFIFNSETNGVRICYDEF